MRPFRFPPMQSSHPRFRFSIARGMAAIAALAAAFAFVSPAVVLSLSCVMTIWLILWRKPRPNPSTLGAPLGCLSCLFGFLAGVLIAAKLVDEAGNRGVVGTGGVREFLTIAATMSCGVAGAIVTGTAARFITPLFEQPLGRRVPSASQPTPLEQEIELVERLLAHAQHEGDTEVEVKLAEYRKKLLEMPDGEISA
jgi:hypothetical protein